VTTNPTVPGGDRLPSLTGLRALAALMVFAFHVYAAGIFASVTVNRLMAHSLSEGVIGVDFFFVLSGFLLTWTAREDDSAPRFWRRRAAKILPNHLVTWVIALVFLSLTGLSLTGGFSAVGADSLPSLFLVQDWFPRAGIYFSMNIPSWSLGCEAFFYLAFPLALRLVRRIPAGLLWATAAALVVVVWCVPLVAGAAFHGGPQVPGLPVTQDRMWFVYCLPPVRMLEFLLGIVLARIVAAGRQPRIGLRAATALTLAGYVGSSYLPYLFGLVAGAVIPLSLLIMAAATADLEGAPSPWRGRTVSWLGNVSFAFYLVHQLAIRWVHELFGAARSWPTAEALGVTGLVLATALLAATLLYYGVEMPLVRRLSRSRRSPAAEPSGDRSVLAAH
jgi:peptidoglycan/LPS O-acetylase OafA/YrhL